MLNNYIIIELYLQSLKKNILWCNIILSVVKRNLKKI